jgi:hypothetical protein
MSFFVTHNKRNFELKLLTVYSTSFWLILIYLVVHIRKGWLVLSLAVTDVRVTYRIMRLIQRRFKLFQWYKYTYIAFLQIIQFTITFCWQKRTKAYSLKSICGQPNKWELTKTMYYKRSITSIHWGRCAKQIK